MITLSTFGPKFGLPDPSPFCMKAMALLKMSGLEHRFEPGDVRKAPKGKMPFINDDGTIVSDTSFIRMHLEKVHGVHFYEGLSAPEKATARAFEKMCEEHLYFCVLHDRWMNDENFNKGPKAFFDIVPAIMRPLVVMKVRRDIKSALHGQGLGRHSDTEIMALAKLDIDALADFLGDKTYFMGEAITGTDAVVHSFVIGGLCPMFDGPIRQSIVGRANLVAYAERLNAHWYPGEIQS